MPARTKLSVMAVVFLLVAIVSGGLLAWSRYSPARPIEITLPSPSPVTGQVLVGGAVNSPGWYPLQGGDSLQSVLSAAGGPTAKADPGQFKLYVPSPGETARPQKVDLNRAEAWLLQALPGIGETRAQAIISYRQRNGLFRSVSDLLKVEGIGTTTYERIKDLVTVGE